MVDCVQAGLACYLMDPFGITGARITTVDEHRFALRCDQQRGGSAFGVDEIDVQTTRVVGGSARSGKERQQEAGGKERSTNHGRTSSGDFEGIPRLCGKRQGRAIPRFLRVGDLLRPSAIPATAAAARPPSWPCPWSRA